MAIDANKVSACLEECRRHLTTELLPFWLDRCKDDKNGGFITHFDKDGKDSGEDEKSMLAQARTVYSMASAHRAGYGDGRCAEYASHGVDFLIDKMWDSEYGGFFWITDRAGNVTCDKKILYGLSFIIYALSEYTMATGDKRGEEYAGKTFDLLKKHAADTMYGGYFEMFERNWDLCSPGSQGGDRKTLDVHMHLMEAFTTLYECTGQPIHQRTLVEDATGIPQFTVDWKVAPQIKFDIVWGWDRFAEGGQKENAGDNTSAGHNVEFAWLLAHATDIMGAGFEKYREIIKKAADHGRDNGVDLEYGGVYVEGPHAGGVYDMEKEFWQQAEVMIGMLGEWWPLMTREGEPIWTHMSHSWKVNYHTIRCMVESIKRLEKLNDKLH